MPVEWWCPFLMPAAASTHDFWQDFLRTDDPVLTAPRPVRRSCPLHPQPGMQRHRGPGQKLAAALEIADVVGVAAVRRAATPEHHPLRAQPTQVIGDQALRLPHQRAQLPDPPIAVRQLGQQPPPQRMTHQSEKARRSRSTISPRPRHNPNNTSNQLDLTGWRAEPMPVGRSARSATPLTF